MLPNFKTRGVEPNAPRSPAVLARKKPKKRLSATLKKPSMVILPPLKRTDCPFPKIDSRCWWPLY